MYNKIKNIIESNIFQNIIISLIVLNGITMGFETSKELALKYETFFHFFDILVITIFTIEILLRIFIHKLSFFKDGWSLFDFFIVFISLIPSSAGFEILRILRVLRLFRLVTVIPQMRKIVTALANVIPGMASVGILLLLLFYISAIMATQLYSETFPQWFGSLSDSFYTLFQIMTLESWSMGIVRPIMEVHPNAWIFFIPFIFIVTFIMINLIIAIVVDAMNELTVKEEEHIINEIDTNESTLQVQLEKLQKDMDELKQLIIEQNKN